VERIIKEADAKVKYFISKGFRCPLDMHKTGEPIPAAIAGKHYSGKFMIRIPPEVHRKLAIQAAESGVSLNRLASSKLSQ
jgi:hypothetical protein